MPPTRRSTRPAAVAAPYARTNRLASDSDSPAPIAKTRNVRSTRNPRTVIEPDSDEDEEMEAFEEPQQIVVEPEDDDMEEESDHMDEGLEDEIEEDDEEEEEEDDEEEDEEDEHPPPPQIKTQPNSKGRPSVVVKPPSEGTLKSVEAKEMEAVDDEDLSDLDSEGMPQELNLDDDNEEPGEDEEDDLDDDDDDDSDRSRSGTPDLTKLTRRQRGQFEDFDGNLIALPNEAQKKKLISAEEHAMRRAEMARRRKNLSEKRNEEEKIDTINKLLKKPAPKRRTRAEILAAQAAGEGGTPGADEEIDEVKPDALYVRWVNSSTGSRIGVPDEWLSAPIGSSFLSDTEAQASATRGATVLVEEVA